LEALTLVSDQFIALPSLFTDVLLSPVAAYHG